MIKADVEKLLETNVVGCQFKYKTEGNRNNEKPSDKTYYYRKCDGIGDISVGDTVVVNCATGFQVVKVVEVNAPFSSAPTAFVVGKVDLEGYERFVAAEAEKKRLGEALKIRKKELEGLLAYEILVSKDSEFASMLEAYKSLGGKLNG